MSTTHDYNTMGKLLGQAFLSHQVSQLEHKVHSRNSSTSNSGPRPVGKRAAPGGIYSRALIGSDEKIQKPNGVIVDTSRPDLPKPTRAADRIVVDTSVLIHALDQVRKWSREAATVIIPLETLRILDLAKKGTSMLAVRARAASRFLEEQVGINEHVMLQEDRAHIPWPDVPISLTSPKPAVGDAANAGEIQDSINTDASQVKENAPQWIRSILGSVAWEVQEYADKKVVLAVMDSLTASGNEATTDAQMRLEQRTNGESMLGCALRLKVPLIKVAERALSDNAVLSNWQTAGRPPKQNTRPPPRNTGHSNKKRGGNTTLVEKPPAPVMPAAGIRLLARGEQLAP